MREFCQDTYALTLGIRKREDIPSLFPVRKNNVLPLLN